MGTSSGIPSDRERTRGPEFLTREELDRILENWIKRIDGAFFYDLKQVVRIKNVLGIDDGFSPYVEYNFESKTINDIQKRLTELESKIDSMKRSE